MIEAQRKRGGHNDDEDDDDSELADVFKGTCLKFFNIELEVKVWQKVKETAIFAMKQYPESYQFDLDLLEKDDKEKQLTNNQRSCVLYRSGEKKILKFLIDAADKLMNLYELPLKEARKEVNKNSSVEYEGMVDYIKVTLYPAL